MPSISEYCEYIGDNIVELYWDRITQDICGSRDNGHGAGNWQQQNGDN